MKKDELVAEVSDLDDIIAFTKGGIMKVVKVSDKVFIGKDILHVAVFMKTDERTTYNMIYVDGKTGISFAKRFNVTGVTRDKEYDLTKGSEKSRVHYFTANANGEAEVVKIILSPNCSARNKEFDFYFEEQDIKSRGSIGNQVTKYPIKSVKFKEAGNSTLDAKKFWFDNKFGRLNTDEKGDYLGKFEAEDRLLVIYNDGNYEITDQELTQRFETEKVLLIEKFDPEKIPIAGPIRRCPRPAHDARPAPAPAAPTARRSSAHPSSRSACRRRCAWPRCSSRRAAARPPAPGRSR